MRRWKRRPFVLATVAAAVPVLFGLPAVAQDARTRDGKPPYEHPQSRALVDRELERQRSRRADRDRPEARRRRAESATRHEDLAPTEVEKLARERLAKEPP